MVYPGDLSVTILVTFLKAVLDHSNASPVDNEESLHEVPGEKSKSRIDLNLSDYVRGGIAQIGVEPPNGRRKKARDEAAGRALGLNWETARKPPHSENMLDALTQAVYHFVEDDKAVEDFTATACKLLGTATLLLGELEASPQADSSEQSAQSGDTYVARPELESKFKQLLKNPKVRIIVLWGEPGMGKSSLAEELTKAPGTDNHAPIRDVSRTNTFTFDLASAFSSLGHRQPLNLDPLAQLAILVTDENAPPVVVLDNLDSADQLRDILPRHSRSKIVATCRHAKESQFYSRLSVERMNRSESRALIRGWLPNLCEDDAEHLAESFGDYPLAMNHVCTTFPNQQLSMAAFCDSLIRDAEDLASQVETGDRAALLAVLRCKMKLVERRSEYAFNLLTLISFIGHRVYRPYLALANATFSGKGADANVRFAYAMTTLKEFAFIQCDDSPEGYVTIHPLTQAILRQELKSEAEDIFGRVIQAWAKVQNDPQVFANIDSSQTALVRDAIARGVVLMRAEDRESELRKNPSFVLFLETVKHAEIASKYWTRAHYPKIESYSEEKIALIFSALVQRLEKRWQNRSSRALDWQSYSDSFSATFMRSSPIRVVHYFRTFLPQGHSCWD